VRLNSAPQRGNSLLPIFRLDRNAPSLLKRLPPSAYEDRTAVIERLAAGDGDRSKRGANAHHERGTFSVVFDFCDFDAACVARCR
jgi:hypothetical protein